MHFTGKFMHQAMPSILYATPINPDAPILKCQTANKRVPLSRGRASDWTLLPVFCVNGEIFATRLIQRCQSLPVDSAKFTSYNDICVGSTETAPKN